MKHVVIHCGLMFNTSARTLRFLALLLWLIGFIVLSFKGIILLLEAHTINPDKVHLSLIIAGGLLLGAIKAKYLFTRLCIKNLNRIDALKTPKLWQFYRIQFSYFYLAC